MPNSLHEQHRLLSLPELSFGPLRFLETVPWLALAAVMRLIASRGGPLALPAVGVACIAVVHAFFVATQRSIELAGGRTNVGALDFAEQIRLSFAIVWRIGILMFATSCTVLAAGYGSLAPLFMLGLDGMAFDQLTDPGKFWSAAIAALILLMIVDAECNDGAVSLFRAAKALARRSLWIGSAMVALGLVYIVLGWGQGYVRGAIWSFWQTSSSSQQIKNLIYFVFIFSFATLRLWVTLLILTYGLKQSYVRGASASGASSARP
jgi:hypothetical protein